MRYEAVLFDLDGTLVETTHLWAESTRHALDKQGIECTEAEHASLAYKLLATLLTEKGYEEADIQRVRSIRDMFLLDLLKTKAAWVKGAESILDSLKDVPMSIVTSSHASIIDALDASMNIRRRVHHVIAAEDVHPDYKPHPKGLLLACERLQCEPEKCVYVGDQSCDLDAAKAAGMTSILVRGKHTPIDLTHTKVVHDLSEIFDALR